MTRPLSRYAQVAAVVRRLSRAPITPHEAELIAVLARVRYGRVTAHKSFVEGLRCCDAMTDATRRYLWRIAHRYRRQLPLALAMEAEAKIAWATAPPAWIALAQGRCSRNS